MNYLLETHYHALELGGKAAFMALPELSQVLSTMPSLSLSSIIVTLSVLIGPRNYAPGSNIRIAKDY